VPTLVLSRPHPQQVNSARRSSWVGVCSRSAMISLQAYGLLCVD
jgi:hypothetical protein